MSLSGTEKETVLWKSLALCDPVKTGTFTHGNTLRDSAQSLQNLSDIYQQKIASLKLLVGKKSKNTEILEY